jgi:hypothetical protein
MSTPRKAAREARLPARELAAVALLALLVLPALPPTILAEPSPTGEGAYTLTSKTVWSFHTETPPPIDDPGSTVWNYPLQVIGLVPGHIALSGGTSLDIRSLYTDTDLYIRVIWQDVVENSGAPQWVFHDDNWTFTSPFEDGLGLYFPISDPLGVFPKEGCMRTCHAQDWENPQNQERKFTYAENETGDMWFWSAGLTNPWDFALDTYVTDHPSNNNVGYYEDPEMGLGLVKNRHLTEYMQYVYMSRPVYMQDPNIPPSVGPDFIVRGEETVFDANLKCTTTGEPGINPITHQPWQNGDVVGGYVLDHLPTEGLGQIAARGSYDVIDQTWSLVMRRPLDTGDPAHDVIFDDLSRTYHFALSLFGDIMGGGDSSSPFEEPTTGRAGGSAAASGSRCVMNKVTNTIALRFRPVVRASMVDPGGPDGWNGEAWDVFAPPLEHELIHHSGEIHDTWDWLNLSAAYDGDRLYLHMRYADPNLTGAFSAEVAILFPGELGGTESNGLLAWYEGTGHFTAAGGAADIWRWDWNATSLPAGAAGDLVVREQAASADTEGSPDVTVRMWNESGSRHVVMSRPLFTGHPAEDIQFDDLARSYDARVAIRTLEWGQWLITYPVKLTFAPDPTDRAPPAPVTGLQARDGGDSDAIVEWTPSSEPDFAHYRIYASDSAFTQVSQMAPVLRISDVNASTAHLRGLRPGRTWHIFVVPVDDSGNMGAAVSPLAVTVTDTTPPPAPGGASAFDGLDSDLLIRWNSTRIPDFDHYEVFLEDAPFATTIRLEPQATIRGMAVASHRVGGLVAGRTYYAAVVAVDWAGNALRAVAGAAGSPTDATPPPEVRGLDCSTPQDPASDGEVLVRWRASSAEDVTRYRVYVSLSPIESLANFDPRADVPITNTSVVLAGLRPGSTYYFAVTAVDGSGHEGPSKYTTSSRASTAAPPSPAVGVMAVQAGPASARVSWQRSNSSQVARYVVLMSRDPITRVGGPNVIVAGNVTPLANTSLLVSGLEPGATYHFAVVVVDTGGRTSAGSPPVASVTLQERGEVEPGPLETWGMPIAIVVLAAVAAISVYVAVSRTRKYGRLMSRRPSWERQRDGKGGGDGPDAGGGAGSGGMGG